MSIKPPIAGTNKNEFSETMIASHITPAAATNSVSVPINEVLPALSNKTLFWRPKFLADDQGLCHLPFLFWLTETVRPVLSVQLGFGLGSSYFALCQATDKLDVDGRCYAVDPQLDDAHSYNQSQYEEFSRLLPLEYDKATAQFSPGSIDILHINLPAEHSSIAKLLGLWLPLLSDSGVILLQNSLLPQPHSWAVLCQQLRQQYQCFELLQDNGLLLLVPGQMPSDSLARLISFKAAPKAFELVQNVFGRLGKACFETVRADVALAKVQQVQSELVAQNQQLLQSQHKIDELLQCLSDNKNQLTDKELVLTQLNTQLQITEQGAKQQQAKAAVRIDLLEQIRLELKQEVESLFSHLNGVRAENEQNQQLSEKWQKDAQHLSDENTALQAELAKLKQQFEAKRGEVDNLSQQLQQINTQQQQSDSIVVQQGAELKRLVAQLQQAATERDNALAGQEKLQLDLLASEQALQQLTTELADTKAELQSAYGYQKHSVELTAKLQSADEKCLALQTQQAELTAELNRQQQAHEAQLEQQQRLHSQELLQLKIQHQSEVDLLHNTEKQQLQEIASLSKRCEAEKKHRFDETATLTKMLTDTQQQAENEISALRKAVEYGSSKRQAVEQELALLQQQQATEGLAKQQLQQQLQQAQLMLRKANQASLRVQAERNKLCHKLVLQQQQLQLNKKLARFSLLKPFSYLYAKARSGAVKTELQQQCQLIAQSGLFDLDYYQRQYPDVQQKGIDPIEHYVRFGAFEGRDPSAVFSSAFYLDSYQDVREAGINPLWHFIKFGKAEGRKIHSAGQENL